VKIDRYGELRDGITTSMLEELKFGYAKQLGAPRISEELNRPAGYEETGGVAQDLPGVGVSIASSTHPNHTMGMLEDAFTEVGHRGFRMDAQIMALVLYHFLTDRAFRQAVQSEHTALQGLYRTYQANLRKAYASEMARPQP
jgi:hypothetical protein